MDSSKAQTNRRALLYSAGLLLLILPLWAIGGILHYRDLVAAERANAQYQASLWANAVENMLRHRTTLLDSFAVHVMHTLNLNHEYDQKDFDSYAQIFLTTWSDIDAFSLAPQGVQRFVYPLEGNEEVIGKDLREHPREQARLKILAAMNSERVLVSDPFEGRDGLLRVTANRGVFHEGTSWGLVTLVIRLDPILDRAGLARDSHLDRAIRTGGQDTFRGIAAVFEKNPVTAPVELPGINWQVAAAPASGWFDAIGRAFVSVHGSALIIIILVVVLTYLSIGRRAQLEAEVASRTAELRHTADKLESALNQARTASLAKDEFLSVMSHELRTPLNPIMGYVELLRETEPDPRRASQLNMIYDAALRQLSLIENILTFVRLDQEGILQASVGFNLHSLCQDIVSSHRNAHPNLEVRFHDATDLPPLPLDLIIQSDRTTFRSVLENLVGNACKFTTEGSVTLETGLLGFDQGFVDLKIRVIDSGPGMASDMLPHLFEPFSQGDVGFTRRHEGAGLGLAIVGKYISVMDGKIQVDTQLGAGTRIELQLRFEAATAGTAAADPAHSSDAPAIASNAHVLVVDDRSDNTRILEGMLQRLGASHRHVSNGQEAVEICQKQTFDLILLDLAMPIMNGFDAAVAIRNTPNPNRTTPIAAISASNDMEEECLQAGMDAYLVKPISLDSLRQVLSGKPALH